MMQKAVMVRRAVGRAARLEVQLQALSGCLTEMYTVTLVNISTGISNHNPQEASVQTMWRRVLVVGKQQQRE